MVVTHSHLSPRLSVYVSQFMILILLLTLVPQWGGATPTQAAMRAAPTGTVNSCVTESFDNITTLTNAGWSLQNLSEPVGSSGWFQGNSSVFSGYSSGYIGANYNSTSGTGTISNWLISPAISLTNGLKISFWTRIPTTSPEYPDRLELRLSTAGASTNVGTSSSSVGDFTTLLLSVNPDLTTGVYPNVWTNYTVTVTGLAAPTTGRVAFRYFVTNGGSNGANSNYIGIDELEYGICPKINVTSPTLLGDSTQFSSTDVGESATYAWEFGDGTSGSGVSVQHTYLATGSYPVTLTVTLSDTTVINTATAYVISTAPGGVVDDLSLWLKADAGVTLSTTDANVTSWADQTGVGHNVAQSNSLHWPTYQENAWNGNPVLHFDTTDYFTRTIYGSDLFGSSESSILFAKHSISGGVWFKWETANNNRVGFELSSDAVRFDLPNDSTGRLIGETSVVDHPHLVAGIKSSTEQAIHLDGTTDISISHANQLNPRSHSTLSIGKQPDGTLNWNGAMGEVIVYKRALSRLEQNQVESYLALKYGLQLGSLTTMPVSYTDSQANTIWTADTIYQHNVAGIGRDDRSGLDQQRSTSTLAGDILTVAHGTLTETTALPSDRSFLIWGHDGISTTSVLSATHVNGLEYTRLARSWQLQRSGNLDAVTIAFDLSDLPPGSYNASNVALLLDTDGDFTDPSIISTGKIIDGQTLSFEVAEIPSEAFMTLMLDGSSLLTVETIGNGTVTSNPAGIDCGNSCSAMFELGTVVTLTATPTADSVFVAWSGTCSGTNLTCQITMDQAKNVIAVFERATYNLTVTKSGTGSGSVTSLPEIDCGTLCSAMFTHGTVVTLTATPHTGSVFASWSGACQGTSLTCTLTLSQTQQVTATFTLNQHELTLKKSGNGSIISNPAGIDCGSTCSATFESGTVVTLTATPDTGSTFVGWSGACSGSTHTCEITLDQASTVTATFSTPTSTVYTVFLPALRR